MRKTLLVIAVMALVLPVSAQIKARWGSIDVRYPVDCKTLAGNGAVDNVTAWRGERVNLQLVVERSVL